MKYHRHLFATVQDTLQVIFERRLPADKVIERLFKDNRKWGKRDRQFVAEAVYESVRWRGTYEFLQERFPGVDLLEIHFLMKGAPLPEWSQVSVNAAELKTALADAPAFVRFSVPEWLYAEGLTQLGEARWHETLRALNETAPLIVRANTLKTTRARLMEEFRRREMDCEEAAGTEEGIILKKRVNVFQMDIFQQGQFEVQDGASQKVAPVLGPRAGERIVDACAGAGGKTLHIAAVMENKGRIIALDPVEKKLEELRRRARRAGVHIVETRAITGTKVIKRLHESADAVLTDVPCSGLGVLKRNPDTKWKLTPERLRELEGIQTDILSSYSKMVKSGGRLVYSTCSVLPSENHLQIERFLRDHDGWSKEFEETLWPQENGL